MQTTSSPRFLVLGFAPRYGSRDEVAGHYVALEATAETRRWAEVLAGRVWESYGENTDLSVEVRDTRPDLAAEERAAELRSQGYSARAVGDDWWNARVEIDDDDDLPF